MRKIVIFVLLVLFLAAVYFLKPAEEITDIIDSVPQNSTDFPLKLPPGFRISIYAKNLGAPRVMAFDPAGNMLVSVPAQGKVVALLPDKNGDGLSDETRTIISGLNKPHGIASRENKIYIAEEDKVVAYDYDGRNLKLINPKKIVDLPSSGGHFTRTIMFMPSPNDDKLLISVGSSCNVCEEQDWRRAKILVANADGSSANWRMREFAKGLRNAVFMAIHPVTGKIWATEMGRDLLGDDIPPDEINIIEEGKNYGWPTCYGKNIHDTNFDKKTYIRNPCLEPFEKESHIDIPAHSAPLGLAFFKNDLLVAYHGSWNRSAPTGYKVVRHKFDENGNYLGVEDFISGWLETPPAGEALGRPVDILIEPASPDASRGGPGGTMFISDDKAGVIYRVTYNKN